MGRPSSVRRRFARVAIAAAIALSVAAPVQARQVEQVQWEINETFVDEFLTETCGTLAVASIVADRHVTLRYNRAGLLVSEIDPSHGGTITVTAPETGGSFSFPFNTTIIDYGDGATEGSAFTMKLVGLAGHVPGYIESDAGQLLLGGIVTGLDEDGFPILEFTDVLAERGHRADSDRVRAAMCAALAG